MLPAMMESTWGDMALFSASIRMLLHSVTAPGAVLRAISMFDCCSAQLSRCVQGEVVSVLGVEGGAGAAEVRQPFLAQAQPA